MIDTVKELQRHARDGTPLRALTPDPKLESSVDFYELIELIATATEGDIAPDDFISPSYVFCVFCLVAQKQIVNHHVAMVESAWMGDCVFLLHACPMSLFQLVTFIPVF